MTSYSRIPIDNPFDSRWTALAGRDWIAVGPDWIYAPGPCWICFAERLRRNGWIAPAKRREPPPRNPRPGYLLTWWPYREHAVAPLPSCSRCRELPGFRTPEEWISPLTGIVRSLEVEQAWPGFWVASGELSQTVYPLLDGRWFVGGRQRVSGYGLTEDQARRSCLYEAAERYSLQWHADENLLVAPYTELRGTALYPSPYSDAQYANRDAWRKRHGSFQWVPERFDPGEPIAWTKVRRLKGRAERYVPAELCYVSVPGRFFYANTNGCAAADSRADAVRRAVYELVERDAVALWWYSRARRPQVKIDHPAESMMELTRRKFWVLDLTHDLGIPVAVAVSCDRQGGRIALGSAAASSMKEASEKAAGEMLMVHHGLLLSTGGPPPNSATDDGALRLWFRDARVTSRPHLRPGPRPPLPPPLAYARGSVPSRDREGAVDGWVKWHTRRDIGVEVARVISPELRHWWAQFAPGRLYDVPPAIGWIERRLEEDELNPEPYLL